MIYAMIMVVLVGMLAVVFEERDRRERKRPKGEPPIR